MNGEMERTMDGWIYRGRNLWMDTQIHHGLDGRMDGWMDTQRHSWIDGCMNGSMDRMYGKSIWMEDSMDGWMEGWREEGIDGPEGAMDTMDGFYRGENGGWIDLIDEGRTGRGNVWMDPQMDP